MSTKMKKKTRETSRKKVWRASLLEFQQSKKLNNIAFGELLGCCPSLVGALTKGKSRPSRYFLQSLAKVRGTSEEEEIKAAQAAFGKKLHSGFPNKQSSYRNGIVLPKKRKRGSVSLREDLRPLLAQLSSGGEVLTKENLLAAVDLAQKVDALGFCLRPKSATQRD